jgi:hypothetical protein
MFSGDWLGKLCTSSTASEPNVTCWKHILMNNHWFPNSIFHQFIKLSWNSWQCNETWKMLEIAWIARNSMANSSQKWKISLSLRFYRQWQRILDLWVNVHFRLEKHRWQRITKREKVLLIDCKRFRRIGSNPRCTGTPSLNIFKSFCQLLHFHAHAGAYSMDGIFLLPQGVLFLLSRKPTRFFRDYLAEALVFPIVEPCIHLVDLYTLHISILHNINSILIANCWENGGQFCLWMLQSGLRRSWRARRQICGYLAQNWWSYAQSFFLCEFALMALHILLLCAHDPGLCGCRNSVKRGLEISICWKNGYGMIERLVHSCGPLSVPIGQSDG